MAEFTTASVPPRIGKTIAARPVKRKPAKVKPVLVGKGLINGVGKTPA